MVGLIAIFKKIQLKDMNAKEYFTILIAILTLTNLVIILNIPFLRQILGFTFFTIIPGLLILHILKLNKIEFIKKFVLSVGLSTVFLIFGGLLVNSFYPIITKPLSLLPLLISFNVFIIILAFIAYLQNRNDYDITDVFNYGLYLKDRLTSTLLFPILFPFMAIFGNHLMNTQGNNIILLIMLVLIPVYFLVVVYLKDRIPEPTYPVAIWMMGMALLLMTGLRSYNLAVGGDVNVEYYLFQTTLNNYHWDNSLTIKIFSNYNSCLSITILPTIFEVFLNIQGIYIFKLVFNLLSSIFPLGTYFIFRKFMDGQCAFISSFFFLAQYPFISMFGWISFRQLIAFIPFVLAIFVLFDDKINNLTKKLLFIIFMFSVVVSHYTTAYIFFILIFSYWFVTRLKNIKFKGAEIGYKNITTITVILFFALIFLWYSQITAEPFSDATIFIKRNLINLAKLSIEELKSEKIFMWGDEALPDRINIFIHNISFTFIAIGILSLIKDRKNTKIDEGYLIMMSLSFGLLVFLVCISSVLVGYGPDRVYQQFLVFLAPAFVMGGRTISKVLSRLNPKLSLSLVIVVIVLIAQFFSATYMIYQFFGVPHSEFLNSDGIRHDMYYMYETDAVGAKWIYNQKVDELNVYGDYRGSFLYAQFDVQHAKEIYKVPEKGLEDYIYLRYVNVINGFMILREGKLNLTEFSTTFIEKNKIYENGGSEVWR